MSGWQGYISYSRSKFAQSDSTDFVFVTKYVQRSRLLPMSAVMCTLDGA